MSAELYHRFTKAAPDAVLYNTYGASEIWDGTFYDPMVDGPVTDEVPLGRPIANTEAYILDRHLQPVPVGIAGELCFGGACLVKGYHNRDNLTRERFIPHPFRDAPGARLYRTGDLVRFRSNGVIDYVGRNDFLINLRGFRIEPAEIEAVLDEHSSVRESLVVVRDASPGNKRLIAYAVPAGVQTDIGELITHMRERLPIFMVPATVIWIESIPLTPSGKRDRQNLPAPLELQSAQWAQTDDPRTNLEKRIAAHFRDVLGAPSVGIHDNFFTDLGGHSLLATRLISRLRDDFRIDLPLRLVFESPTIERLAAALVNRIADPGDEAVAAILADAEELSDEEVSSLLEEVRDKFTETRP